MELKPLQVRVDGKVETVDVYPKDTLQTVACILEEKGHIVFPCVMADGLEVSSPSREKIVDGKDYHFFTDRSVEDNVSLLVEEEILVHPSFDEGIFETSCPPTPTPTPSPTTQHPSPTAEEDPPPPTPTEHPPTTEDPPPHPSPTAESPVEDPPPPTPTEHPPTTEDPPPHPSPTAESPVEDPPSPPTPTEHPPTTPPTTQHPYPTTEHPSAEDPPSPPVTTEQQPLLKRPMEEKSYKKCMVPGCGKEVLRVWNHIYQTAAHKALSKEEKQHYVRLTSIAAKRGKATMQPSRSQSVTLGKEEAAEEEAAEEQEEEEEEGFSTQRLSITTIGRQKFGSSRTMGSFAKDTPALVAFRRFLGSHSGGSKNSNQQMELSIDLSKFLYFCDPASPQVSFLGDISKIENYLTHLRRMKIGPSGQIAKLQVLVLGQTFVINGIPGEASEAEKTLSFKISNARDKTKLFKRGIGKEKGVVAAKKREFVSKNLGGPEELLEFLGSEEVQKYVTAVAADDPSHLDVRRFLMVFMTYTNFQREGPVRNMTVKEVEKCEKFSGHYVVNVWNHKTAATHGSARIVMPDWVHKLLEQFVKAEKGVGPNLVFRTSTGERVTHIGTELVKFSERFGKKFSNITPTVNRKAISTAVGLNSSEAEERRVASYMSHSIDVARSSYQHLQDDRRAVDIYQTLQKTGSWATSSALEADNPATTGPATTGSVTTGPATTDPATTGPATTGPATTGPATTGPATTGPATTGPATTDPATDRRPKRPAVEIPTLPLPKKRRRTYTMDEAKEIKDHFKPTKDTPLPTLAMCRAFLRRMHILGKFQDRSDKNVQDKIDNMKNF